jgi:hypothetical protein
MEDVKFEALAAALARPTHVPSGTKLRMPDPPAPFVPPIFQQDEGVSLEASEVILVRASAAVGKTTIARALSAERGVPILDLAKVPVATGSLSGILNDFHGDTPAIQAFHAGNLPLLVDALDEGRLNSGDNGLLSFIETSAELILQDRRNKKPKLVMLGRPEAIAYAHLYLTDAGVEVATLDVGFFDEQGARELVHAYATVAADQDSLYLVHRKPAELLITTYFAKIATALGLEEHELWTQPTGRSFAGYAPVLAAIGSLLPKIDNFAEAQNSLEEVGTNSAWGVIESVLGSIIRREQGKVTDQLRKAGMKAASTDLYSPIEQASLLLQFVQRLPLSGTGQIRLAAGDTALYSDQVRRFLPEHPFLKEGRFGNDVIASYVLATAIIKGWQIRDEALVRQLARQPFLWRSLKSSFDAETILEGESLGYILSSFWSDPLTNDESVAVRDLEGDNGSFVKILFCGDEASFTATTPLHFYSQMRNVSVNTSEPMTLIGVGDGATRVFSMDGENRIVGSVIDLRATELRLRGGSTWLDAEISPSSGQFSLVIQTGTDYGWSDKLSSIYPFSTYPGTLSSDDEDHDDELVHLLSDCATRAPSATSITLFTDYSVADNDYLRGVYTKHGNKFVELVNTLVEEGYAHTSAIQASGSPKIRVRLKVPFSTLRDAARGSSNEAELTVLVKLIRERIARA